MFSLLDGLLVLTDQDGGGVKRGELTLLGALPLGLHADCRSCYFRTISSSYIPFPVVWAVEICVNDAAARWKQTIVPRLVHKTLWSGSVQSALVLLHLWS